MNVQEQQDLHYRARQAVRLAVKEGRLPRVSTLACADCGARAHHYHHHRGYQPENHLSVEPLCRSCHGRHPSAPFPKPRVAMVEERPLTVREVAEQLRVNLDTVRRWLRDKKMHGRKIGGRRGYLIAPSEVRRFMKEEGRDG